MKNLSSIVKNHFFAIWLIFTGLILSFAALFALTPEEIRLHAGESSFIEIFSAMGYVFVALYMLPLAVKNKALFGLAAPILLLFGARELDLHKAFTTGSFLKLPYFTREFTKIDGTMVQIPYEEKVMAGIALILIFSLVVGFVIFNFERYIKVIRDFYTPAITATISILWMGFTKTWDIIPRFLRKELGITLSEDQIAYVGGFEEMIELLIPILMFLAVLQFKLYYKKID